jgi:NTE family protein
MTPAKPRQAVTISTQAYSPTMPTVGLALGGGAARGLAHIVALEALDDLGVRPKVIAGTSMGALIGALYAAGFSAAAIRAHANSLLKSKTALVKLVASKWPGAVTSLWHPKTLSMFNGETLFEILMPDGMARDFETLRVPYIAIATDFYSQEEVVLRDGPLIPAVAASCALPALLKPVTINDRVLIDGGFVNPTPFDHVQADADVTVAVDVTGSSGSRRGNNGSLPNSIDALLGAAQITLHSITREKLRRTAPDILIRPPVTEFGALDFYQIADILDAAAPAKEELKRKLAEKLEAVAVS